MAQFFPLTAKSMRLSRSRKRSGRLGPVKRAEERMDCPRGLQYTKTMNKIMAAIFLVSVLYVNCAGAGPDYLPLAAGNLWKYESQVAADGAAPPKTSAFSIAIASEKKLANGNVEFRDGKNELIYLRSPEGVFDGKGRLLLKFPVAANSEWPSGADNYFIDRCRVTGSGLACATRFKTYKGCLRVRHESDYFTVEKQGRIQQLAFERVRFYAPGVGMVQEEVYELDRSRKRTLAYRTELVSFARHAALPPVPAAPAGGAAAESPVPRDKAFRFPEQLYSSPALSPDGRWVIYREYGAGDEKWFYTAVGREDKNPLPLAAKAPAKYPEIGLFQPCWSRDGKTLAIFADMDDKHHALFLDFSGAAPRFLSDTSLVSMPENPTWMDSGEILYIEPYNGQLWSIDRTGSRKVLLSRPNGPFGPSGHGPDRFQATRGGIILYHAGDGIFLTALPEPGPGERVLTSAVLKSFSLSPDGRFALLYDYTFQNEKATLFDLAARKAVKTMPKPERAEWSPDGAALAYAEKNFIRKAKDASGRDSFENNHFFIMDAASGRERDLGYGVGESFTWTPDSRRIVFSSLCSDRLLGIYEQGIFVMDAADGKMVGKVARVSTLEPPQLSADGKIIVWDALDIEGFFVVRNPF